MGDDAQVEQVVVFEGHDRDHLDPVLHVVAVVGSGVPEVGVVYIKHKQKHSRAPNTE